MTSIASQIHSHLQTVGCYSEIKRMLKPGQCFAACEWVVTDVYDPKNEEHKKIKADIEIGNGLPNIRTGEQVVEALKAAGFEVIRVEDLVKTAQVPWYEPLDPERISLSNFRVTSLGRFFTQNMVYEEICQAKTYGSLKKVFCG